MFRRFKWLRTILVIIGYPVVIALSSLLGVSGLILWMGGGVTLLPGRLQQGLEMRILNALFTNPQFHLDRLYEQFANIFLFIIEYIMQFVSYFIGIPI